MENNNLIEYKIQGSCTCGNVKYVNTNEKKTLKDIWGIFICHCSQCPIQSKTWKDERLQSVGTPWIAIPRSSFSSINYFLGFGNSILYIFSHLFYFHISPTSLGGKCDSCPKNGLIVPNSTVVISSPPPCFFF